MSNSEKILKVLSNLIESGVLSSKDLKKEISNELKFKKDKIVNKLELVSRQEFEILKKIVQKQEKPNVLVRLGRWITGKDSK